MTSSTESRLADLAGLANAKRLVRTVASGETGVHSVLLYGPKGCGKGQLALALAEAWVCRNPQPAGADGVCQACAALGRGNNPDVQDIVPAGLSNLIRVSAITEGTSGESDGPPPLQTFFRTGPLMSRHKVAILHDAHRMTGEATNSLLKTLEEPFPHAKLILTTDSVGGVLPTILSRCLAVACELPTSAEVAAMVPGATADDLLLAEGAPGRAKVIVQHAAAFRRIPEFARGLLSRGPEEALKASEEFRAIAEGLDKALGCGARNANAEALGLLAGFLARMPEANPRWAQLAIEAHRRIQGNGNAGMVCDALFARMLHRRTPAA